MDEQERATTQNEVERISDQMVLPVPNYQLLREIEASLKMRNVKAVDPQAQFLKTKLEKFNR
jgi:hypothetical protein